MEGLDEDGARGRGGGVRSGVSAGGGGRGGGGRGGVSGVGGAARGWGFRTAGVEPLLLSGRLRVRLDSAADTAAGREVATSVMAGRSEVVPLAVRDEPPAAESKKQSLGF